MVRKSTRRVLGILLVLTPVAGVQVHTARGAPLTATWSQLRAYPTPITNNAVTSVCEGADCTVYSFMGMTNPTTSGTITAASYKLTSPGTGAWISIADAPRLDGRAKIAASAITCAGQVYLIGGYSVSLAGEITEKRLFRYDPVSNEYVQLADVPTEVDDTVVGCYQDRYIYLVSGWHGPTFNNTTAVQVYDTTLDSWQQATPIPVGGRFGHAGSLIDNRLVFIDGSADSGGFPLVHSTLVGTIDAGDPTLVTWAQPAASPFSPTYRAANSTGFDGCDRLFVSGGTDNPYNFNGNGYNGQPSNPLSQLMVYDPAADDWQLIDDSAGTHTLTMDHRGLVWFNGRWVTVGGMTGPGVATDAVQAVTISELCPSDVPVPASSEWGAMVLTLLLLTCATVLINERRRNA